MRYMSGILVLLCFLLPGRAGAQTPADSSLKPRFFGIPIVYYTPETRLAFGLGGITTFYFPGDTVGSRVSSVYAGALYTQLRQVLTYAVYQLWPDNGRYNLWGELAWYRYNFYLYQTGKGSPTPEREYYGMQYPRFRLNALRQVQGNWYAGLRYSLEQYRLFDLDPAGRIARGEVPGSAGGLSSGPGLALKFDNRDNQFYPTRGWYLDAWTQHEGRFTGSDFTYGRYTADLAYYRSLGRHTLALNAFVSLGSGQSPFYLMSMLGGPRRLRGIYEGRYRDENAALIQAEYRVRLFWRLGAVAFGGIGTVGGKPGELLQGPLHPAWGGGLRFMFDKKQRINLRADAGVDAGQVNYYLTISEAF